jgi:hypothetical protein
MTKQKAVIMDAKQMERAMVRIAHEIVEQNKGIKDLMIIGIKRRGDTLGKRINEIILPIPKDKDLRERIARETRETVLGRVKLRNRAGQIALEVEGLGVQPPDEVEAETL